MLDADGLPPYPPARNAWQYPPPPVNRRWFWVAIVGTVVALVASVAMVSTAVVLGNRDYPGLIDDGELLSLIADECEVMTATIDATPVAGGVRRQSAVIRAQDRAVRSMLTTIRSRANLIAGDRPTAAWLQDWDRLLQAREDYRRQLIVGEREDLTVPEDADGEWITVRMNEAFVDRAACIVPVALLYPYPGFDPDGDPDSAI